MHMWGVASPRCSRAEAFQGNSFLGAVAFLWPLDVAEAVGHHPEMTDEEVSALIVVSALSQDVPIGENFIVPDDLLALVAEYEEALDAALVAFVQLRHPDWSADEVTAIVAELQDEGDAPYLVLMTLNGEGIGIWDGSWDRWVTDPDEMKLLQQHLQTLLGVYADDTGGGRLNQALYNAAWDNAVYDTGIRSGVIYEAN